LVKVSSEKQTALDWVDANENRMSKFDKLIWSYAEPAWREYRSAALYCKILREEGFKVIEGTGGMPTAFLATYGGGKPVLATYAEYDAVPGTSQKAVTQQEPRDKLNRWAAGHTDPHSALGSTALTGVLAAKEAIMKHGLKGTLKIFGEPAEKVCGSKPVHAAWGYFNDHDAAICYHPSGYNSALLETQNGAYWSVVFTFECIEPEKWFKPVGPMKIGGHAGGRPPAALDAVCLMYTTTKYTKEAMLPHSAYWTLNEYVMVAGQCTSDNLPPRIGQIQYAWRCPTLGMAEQIYSVLENNAKHVAEITFCRLSVRWITKTRLGLPNNAMTDITYRNFEAIGPPIYGEKARKVGREIQKNLGFEPMDDPFTEVCQTLTTPKKYEEEMRKSLEPWQMHFGADDYVDYTWHSPCVRLYSAKAMLRPPESGYTYPHWTSNAMGGIPSTIDPMIMTGGKVIATTFVDLLMDPSKLENSQKEFRARTGGGINGSKWVAPLLPKDFKAPIDMRWPEYIVTQRGEEWWIPTLLES
jgi:aminobenzoyl-glutamate utilization protein B